MEEIEVLKSSGERTKFSLNTLRNSLKHSGASHNYVEQIIEAVKSELYEGITTREIYNRAFAMLKKRKPVYASKYKLKKAIYELGPTGFPFEHFVAAVLTYSGYKTKVGEVLMGKCVTHEIDVMAEKNGGVILIECKFHSEEGRNCNVKIPLYIASRYKDVKLKWDSIKGVKPLTEGWVVTNTRFTADAIQYGDCVGLILLSWDYPKDNGIKDRIDRLGLYPITVSTLLTKREKQFLLDRKVVLCRELLKQQFLLDHLGLSTQRRERVLQEISELCSI